MTRYIGQTTAIISGDNASGVVKDVDIPQFSRYKLPTKSYRRVWACQQPTL